MTEAFRDGEEPRVVIRDKRRIDPDGTVRTPDPSGPASGDTGATPAPAAPELAELQALLDERTGDLQRLKAEFDNYRRRVERDRQAMAEQAIAGVLVHLLPVLDDVDRAREHGEVTGGFKSVADALAAALEKLGLQRLGLVGDPFDPMLHEAVVHQHSTDVTEPTCVTVMRPGYTLGDRLLRPAMVGVAEPPDAAAAPAPDAAEDAARE